MSGILLFISVLPSVVLGYYVYKKDKVEPEPGGLLAKIFIFGCLSIIPAVILELILAGVLEPIGISDDSNLLGLFLYYLIGVGLVEEGCKWLIMRLTTWNNKEFDHIFDALVYAVFASLGFATLENILYVFQNGLYTGILRAVLSVPGHAFFGVYMGYYYGIAKQCHLNGQNSLSSTNLLKSIGIPTLIHGLFDFLLSTEYEEVIIVYFALVIFLYITAFIKINRFSKIQSNLQNPFGIQPSKNVVPGVQYVQMQVGQPIAQPQVIQQQPMMPPTTQQPIQIATVPAQSNAQAAQTVQQPATASVPTPQPMPQPASAAVPTPQPMPQPAATPAPQPVQQEKKFCPNCGTPTGTGPFCPNCGFKIK
ncbi:MAG: PrsW family intramembrane metalloprotease [Bacilli bacterium]|nr:PrsW family intramembrane metalloprotease [Bacilli bacterium]